MGLKLWLLEKSDLTLSKDNYRMVVRTHLGNIYHILPLLTTTNDIHIEPDFLSIFCDFDRVIFSDST